MKLDDGLLIAEIDRGALRRRVQEFNSGPTVPSGTLLNDIEAWTSRQADAIAALPRAVYYAQQVEHALDAQVRNVFAVAGHADAIAFADYARARFGLPELLQGLSDLLHMFDTVLAPLSGMDQVVILRARFAGVHEVVSHYGELWTLLVDGSLSADAVNGVLAQELESPPGASVAAIAERLGWIWRELSALVREAAVEMHDLAVWLGKRADGYPSLLKQIDRCRQADLMPRRSRTYSVLRPF
ncbi:hypothetical protein [Lentzea sp. E54]|uniref:hypothetical protein n=1 Tax=Lentzea xerophila TaxID=3435883 RepID=UPI003DA3B9E7